MYCKEFIYYKQNVLIKRIKIVVDCPNVLWDRKSDLLIKILKELHTGRRYGMIKINIFQLDDKFNKCTAERKDFAKRLWRIGGGQWQFGMQNNI